MPDNVNECPKLGNAKSPANVRNWVWPEAVGQGVFAYFQTFPMLV